LHAIKALALICAPIVPKASSHLFNMLGIYERHDWLQVARLIMAPGHKLAEPKILFEKVEDSVIEEQIQKLHSLVKS
jgi:methionyl-tRNA synthetase